MKPDINTIVNKLLSYAFDNLLLDVADEIYMLNRLAPLCGIASPVRDENVDYGDATLAELLDELKTLKPDVDAAAVAELLFPMPRTINYYLDAKMAKGAQTGLDFLYDLYAAGYNVLSHSEAYGKDGYLSYARGDITPIGAASLDIGEDLVYTPLVRGNKIGRLENPDLLSADVISREIAYVGKMGGAIATRIGAAAEYCCCNDIALTSAPVKQQISTGTVKVALLDYPVPVLAFCGIAKNSVANQAARAVKAAADSGLPLVVAAAPKDGVTIYLVFATDIVADGGGILVGSDALATCGVFNTIDCTPLLSVLEKGTALSTDLAAFKPVYDMIGGTKYGAKAKAALGGALVDIFVRALPAAASCTQDQAAALAATK